MSMRLDEVKKIFLRCEIRIPEHDEDKFNDPIEIQPDRKLNSQDIGTIFSSIQTITEGMWHQVKDLPIPL